MVKPRKSKCYYNPREPQMDYGVEVTGGMGITFSYGDEDTPIEQCITAHQEKAKKKEQIGSNSLWKGALVMLLICIVIHCVLYVVVEKYLMADVPKFSAADEKFWLTPEEFAAESSSEDPALKTSGFLESVPEVPDDNDEIDPFKCDSKQKCGNLQQLIPEDPDSTPEEVEKD